jgi:DtxR family Mn-dependent transcriptional regulator
LVAEEEAMNPQQRLEEGLELLYLLKERGTPEHAIFLRECSESDPKLLLEELRRERLVEQDGSDLHLTRIGLQRAEGIIRRHRLAEVLMYSVLQIGNLEMEETACVMEHILSEDSVDRVCTFLGHPTHCPHGGPIPPGRCCRLTTEEDERVQPLSEMNVGDLCEVVHIRPRHHARLDRLGAYGLVPKSVVRLHQKRPSFVIQIDETDLALDIDIAGDIYVRKSAGRSKEG